MSEGYRGPYTPPHSAPPPGDTFPPLVGTDEEDKGVSDWKARAGYWKNRALNAEAENRRLQRQATDDGWALSNFRDDARRRRDAEIGEMGGGG